IWDIERQTIIEGTNPTYFPFYYGLSPNFEHGSNYFRKLLNLQERRAFMVARLNIFPSAVTLGRYSKTTYKNRLCKFCQLEPDSASHILTRCPSHHTIHQQLLDPYISKLPPIPDIITSRLLADKNPSLTESIAKYLLLIHQKDSPVPFTSQIFTSTLD
ncbi:hypothetical protein JRQ81_005346, partial [Phrynocephalus forsythii]